MHSVTAAAESGEGFSSHQRLQANQARIGLLLRIVIGGDNRGRWGVCDHGDRRTKRSRVCIRERSPNEGNFPRTHMREEARE